MGKFLSRALSGAGEALGKGVKAADNLIDGPVTDSIRHATDTGKHAVNRVSKDIADRTIVKADTTDNTPEEYGDATTVSGATDKTAEEYGDATEQSTNVVSHNTNHIHSETHSFSTMFCRQCGSKIPEDSRFCSRCGYNLGAAAQPVDATPPTQPAPSVVSQGATANQKENICYKYFDAFIEAGLWQCPSCERYTIMCSKGADSYVICINPKCKTSITETRRNKQFMLHSMLIKDLRCHKDASHGMMRSKPHSDFDYVRTRTEYDTVTTPDPKNMFLPRIDKVNPRQVTETANNDIENVGWRFIKCGNVICETRLDQSREDHELITAGDQHHQYAHMKCSHCGYDVKRHKSLDYFECQNDHTSCPTISKKGLLSKTKRRSLKISELACPNVKLDPSGKHPPIGTMNEVLVEPFIKHSPFFECNACPISIIDLDNTDIEDEVIIKNIKHYQ